MEWIFDGVGTLLVGLLLGGIGGGAVGYRIGSVRVTKMSQRAGDHASMTQVLNVDDSESGPE